MGNKWQVVVVFVVGLSDDAEADAAVWRNNAWVENAPSKESKSGNGFSGFLEAASTNKRLSEGIVSSPKDSRKHACTHPSKSASDFEYFQRVCVGGNGGKGVRVEKIERIRK